MNIVKTQAMIIVSAQKLGQKNRTLDIPSCFQVNGNEIDIVHETKYLPDEKFKWNNEAKYFQKKMSQALGF